MFGLSWGEFMIVGVVALIIIGPKDLPALFRTIGEYTGKARSMAREFSRAMEQAADDSGVKDINKTLRAATNPTKFGTDAIRESVSSATSTDVPKQTLSPERQAQKDKMDAAMAKAATTRKAKEQAAAEATKVAKAPAAKKPATKKPAAKKPAAAKAEPTAAKPKAKSKPKPKAKS